MYKEKLISLFSKEKILSVLKHPQESPKETVLLLGMILIIVFIILTLIAIFAVKPAEKKERKGTPAQMALIATEIAVVLMLLFLTGSLIYTSQPQFCRACHQRSNEYQEWKTSVHKRVGCLACHQEPGVFGFIAGKIERFDDSISTIKKYYFKIPYRIPIRARVSNSSCRRCHLVERKTLVSHTIKVSHKEFLKVGYKCTDCHNTVTHNKTVSQPKFPSMDKCVLCHNNKIALAQCRLCHVPDVGRKPRQVMDYPKIHLEPPSTCRGCHSIEKCNECHGLEMPHPKNWKKKHPREGFVNKKVCWNCHDIKFCQECHPRMPWPHPDDFPETHGKASEQPGSCGCHRREKFCSICHEGKE
jgi:nitrate/TMAO reductase-like tetraheme cytochrome c subunit